MGKIGDNLTPKVTPMGAIMYLKAHINKELHVSGPTQQGGQKQQKLGNSQTLTSLPLFTQIKTKGGYRDPLTCLKYPYQKGSRAS